MPQQFLDRPDVVARLQQMGGKAVPQCVASGRLGQARSPYRLPHRPLQALLVQVVSALLAAAGVNRTARRREHILPAPFLGGVRILSIQGIRQIHLAKALLQIMLVEHLDLLQMRPQKLGHRLRQHRHPVFLPLAVAHRDLAHPKIHVLHPQPHAFQQPQPCAI